MDTKLCFLLLAVFVLGISCTPTRERRQTNNGNGVEQPLQPDSSTTTTTPSPRYTACLNSCLSTQEYNPVCGTDGVTYNNLGRLNCAIRCGKNVQQSRGGACQAAT